MKSPGIGKNRFLPVHEFMQPSKLPDQIPARPDKEVVGIAENNLGTQLVKIFRRDRLDSSLGADRHENRCFDPAVQGVDNSGSGPAFS